MASESRYVSLTPTLTDADILIISFTEQPSIQTLVNVNALDKQLREGDFHSQAVEHAPPESPQDAGSQGRRETLSLGCHCPHRSDISPVARKQTVIRVKSKTSQCFISRFFFSPMFRFAFASSSFRRPS